MLIDLRGRFISTNYLLFFFISKAKLTYSIVTFKKGIKIFLSHQRIFCLTVIVCVYNEHCLQLNLANILYPTSPGVSLPHKCIFNVL